MIMAQKKKNFSTVLTVRSGLAFSSDLSLLEKKDLTPMKPQ